MSKTSFAIAAAVALATLTGGISAASAGGMGMHMHGMAPMHVHNDFFRHHRGIGIIVANATGGCGFLYDRWLATGDFYWKYRFESCRSDW